MSGTSEVYIKNNIKGDAILSVLITDNALCCSLWSSDENSYESIFSINFKNKNNYIEEIKTFFEKENIFYQQYKKVNIVVATNKNTIVPTSKFSEDKLENIFYNVFEYDKNEKVLFSKLPKTNTIIIYSIDKQLYDFFLSNFSNIFFNSISLPFIEFNFEQNKHSENKEKIQLYIQIFDNYFEILLLQNNKISFYNTYKYKTENDFLYYVINIFDKLQLSQEKTRVCISGFVDSNSLTIIMLKKFVRIVYFAVQNTNLRYNYLFNDLPSHYYHNFLNIIECE